MNSKLPDGRYIFEWGGLVENAGGLTRAMLKRANVFIREGIYPTILLSARGIEQLNAVEHYKKNGFSLIEEKNFVVMEEWLGNKLMDWNSEGDKGNLLELIDRLPFQDKENFREFYKDAEIYAIEEKNFISRLRKITLCEEKDTKRIYWNGILSRKVNEKVDESGKRIKTEKFYAKNGFCFMVVYNSFFDGKWNVDNIQCFSEKERSIRVFASLENLREYFFSEYVKECIENEIFVFCDPILDFEPGFRYMKSKDKKIYRIALVHGVGLGGERKWNSSINPRIDSLIQKSFPPQLEALILLTKEAKEMFEKRLGRTSILYYLPNTITIPNTDEMLEKRDVNKIVYIGRLDEKQKQISHAIKAFAISVRKCPELEFHIYGSGKDKDLYQSLIKSLNMQNKIFLHGFTNDVNRIYQSAGLTLSTSLSEGFSLSCLEALANGCPVISYNFCFGPKDCIIDGENGFIVEQNDIDGMAKKIEYLANNCDELDKMSRNAIKLVQVYNEDHYLENWKDLLNKVMCNYKKRNNISTFDFLVKEYKIFPEKPELEVRGIVKIVGDIPKVSEDNYKFIVRNYYHNRDDFTMKEVDYAKKCNNNTFEIRINIEWRSTFLSLCLEWDNTFIEKEILLPF